MISALHAAHPGVGTLAPAMNRALALIALLLLAAFALTGCGSEPREVTKAQYQKELDRVGRAASDAGSALGQSIDIATFNGNVDKFQETLRDVSDDLEGLKPPANVQDTNERLADSLDEFADELEPVKEARRESIFKARDKLFEVARSGPVKDARAAIRELKRMGYDIRALESL